jgi:hypothetical protein
MTPVKAGDEVRVFDVNGKRVGQPESGWPGTVVKVGRTLAHVAYGARTETFRISDGTRNDAYEHRYFLTMADARRETRRAAADAVLRERKIQLDYGNLLTIEQIEALAEVARNFTDTKA